MSRLLARPEGFVAAGPVAGTDWCVLPGSPPSLVAPGGVVLCVEGTLTPHPDAEQAAQSAWEMLSRWATLRAGYRPLTPGRTSRAAG